MINASIVLYICILLFLFYLVVGYLYLYMVTTIRRQKYIKTKKFGYLWYVLLLIWPIAFIILVWPTFNIRRTLKSIVEEFDK